MEYQF